MSVHTYHISSFYSLNNTLMHIKTLISKCVEYQLDWFDQSSNIDNLVNEHAEAEKELERLKVKILRQSKKMLFFGRTAAGKSTLLNVFIGQKLLRVNFGISSMNLVEIKKSDCQETYVIKDKQKYSLQNFYDWNETEFSQTKIELLVAGNSSLLDGETYLYDTPGIDADVKMDEMITKHCADADVIILIINGMGTLGLTDKKFLQSHKTLFSHFNIHVVFNFWDIVSSSSSSESLKRVRAQHEQVAKDFMVTDLNMTESETKGRIHFISANDCLPSAVATNGDWDTDESIDPGHMESLQNFNVLRIALESEAQHNLQFRQRGYLMECHNIVKGLWSHTEAAVSDMESNSSELAGSICDCLAELDDFNVDVNQILSTVFRDTFEEYIQAGLDMEKKFNGKPEPSAEGDGGRLINGDDSGSLEMQLQQLLETSVDSLLDRSKEGIRAKATEKVIDKEKLNKCLHILDNLYFPLFFDLSRGMQMCPYDEIKEGFIGIGRTIRQGRIGTIVGCTIAGAACLATGGIAIPIVAAAEIGLLATFGLAGAGVAVGTAIGSGSSVGIISRINMPFRSFWKNDESTIRATWTEFEGTLSDSYTEFMNEMNTNVNHIILPLREESNRIENKVNDHMREFEDDNNTIWSRLFY